MDQFQIIIDKYEAPSVKEYRHINDCLKILLKEDLAEYEIEWIVLCLFTQPIQLATTLSEKKHEATWNYVIGDCFACLSDMIQKWTPYMDKYTDDIISVTLETYAPHVRKRAIQCVTTIVRCSGVGVLPINQYITILNNSEESLSCRVPLYELLGEISRHRPDYISLHAREVWVTFKSGLEQSKLTDSLAVSILSGMNGYMDNFGDDIAVVELYDLYEQITNNFIRKHNKALVYGCINIIGVHASLFSEKIIKDGTLKLFLWNALENQKYDDKNNTIESIYKCLESIYCIIVTHLLDNVDELHKIIQELYDYTLSKKSVMQEQACRLLSVILKKNAPVVSESVKNQYNRQILDESSRIIFELEQRILAPKEGHYDAKLTQLVEKACWLAVDGHALSDALFRIIILCYGHISKAKVIAHALLNAEQYRATAVVHLITVSCESEDEMTKYMSLWECLFDSNHGTDTTVINKAKYIFDEFFNYVLFYLDVVLDVGNGFAVKKDDIQTKLSSLFHLSSKLIRMENVMEWLMPNIVYLIESTLFFIERFGITDGAVTFVTELMRGCSFEDVVPLKPLLNGYYRKLQIEKCNSEALLCVNCLALIHAPVSFFEDPIAMDAKLNAFDSILRRKDVDSKLFVEVIDSFEVFLVKNISLMDANRLSELLQSIDKIGFGVNTAGKHGRVLRRKLLLLFGKYGGYINNVNELEKLKLKRFKEYLTLDLPNCIGGDLLKINLHGIIRLSIKEDDFNTLYNILLILCAKSDSIKNLEGIECLIIELAIALCRCVRAKVGVDKMADVERLINLYNNEIVIQCLIESITSERSPGVRSLLCELLRAACACETRVHILHSHIQTLSQSIGYNRIAFLNLIDVLLNSLKSYNDMCQKYLPKLFILIIKTDDPSFVKTFDSATDFYSEKRWLFDEAEIRNLCQDLLKSNLSSSCDVSTFEIRIERSLEFIKGTNCAFPIEWIKEELFFKLHDERLGYVEFSKVVYLISKMSDVLFLDDLKKVIKESCFGIFSVFVKFMDASSDDEDVELLLRAGLQFLTSFYDELRDERYEETINFLSRIIRKLPTLHFNKLYGHFNRCCTAIGMKFGSVPDAIVDGACLWLNKMNIDNITKELEEELKEASNKVNTIKLFLIPLNIKKSNLIISNYAENFKQWSVISLEKHKNGITNEKYKKALNDALFVSLLFMSDVELATLLVKACELTGDTSFCQAYMNVLSNLIVISPVLTYEGIQPYVSGIVLETLKYYGRKGFNKVSDGDGDELYDLVEKHWQCITKNNHNAIQHLIELDKSGSNVNRNGFCIRWLRMRVEDPGLVPILLSDLPNVVVQCGDLFRDPIIKFSNTLPLRLSEFSTRCDPRLFTVLLDALATTGNLDILDILYRRVIAKDESGWWNDAIDKCMTKLATRGDINVSLKLYEYVEKCPILTTCVSQVLLVPLLRYSNRRYNEDFFSKTLRRILEKLTRVAFHGRCTTTNYEKHLINYTNSFLLLQVMFEKVSSSSLEEPNSILNEVFDAKRTWYLPSQVCTLCMTLRQQPREGTSDDFSTVYRKFQCENYNTIAAALCKRRPLLKFYDNLFDSNIWELIVDCEKEYRFDFNMSDTRRHRISSNMERVPANSLRTTTRNTCRTLFLGTLSDNPLKYDLLNEKADEEQITQEVHLQDNELNCHPCTAVISLLLSQLSNLTDDERPSWIGRIAAVLSGTAPRNVKWFLSQIIINDADDLLKYSAVLIPSLWSVINETCLIADGRKYLNGLHVNIIRTILKWSSRQGTLYTPSQDDCLALIINTFYQHKTKLKSLAVVLQDYVESYKDSITIKWDFFDVHSHDPNIQDITLDILLKILRYKTTYIPQLLTYTLNKIQHFDKDQTRIKEVSELFGLSLTACRSAPERDSTITKFRSHVKRIVEKESLIFIKLLYYVSLGNKDFFNEYIFSKLIYLAPKQTRSQPPKKWCYALLSTYLSSMRERDDTIREMFETVNLEEMLTEDDADIAIRLAESGFHLMDEAMKNRLVFLISDIAVCGDVECRFLCAKFFLKAFQDTLKFVDSEPASKRNKPNTPTSVIIESVSSDDLYVKCVCRNVGIALVDNSAKVHEEAYTGLLRFLNKEHLGVRFCEIISLVMALPIAGAGNTDAFASISAGNVALVATKLWLQVLRDDNNFKNKFLSDVPMKGDGIPNSDIQSRLLTMSKLYIGTFRPSLPRTRKSSEQKAMLNIQVPMEDVLVAVLKFCETNTEASIFIFMEIFLLTIDKEDDIRIKMAAILFLMLQGLKLCELTKIFIRMARVIAQECSRIDGFIIKVKELLKTSKGTEAELLVKLLYEELLLNTSYNIQFTKPDMYVPSHKPDMFSLTELSKHFNELSNWDVITEQKRRRYCRMETSFWTDNNEFSRQMKMYDRNDALYKMFSMYSGGECNKWNNWLDRVGTWPRSAFCVSALTEAFTSHSIDELDCDWLNSYTTISRESCAALWAVRFMIRSSKLASKRDDLHKYELEYVKEMNRRAFTMPALQCIQRNVRNLNKIEEIDWHLEKCKSLRNNGGMVDDRYFLLKNMLDECVSYTSLELTPNRTLSLQNMILKLKFDLNLISGDEIKNFVNYKNIDDCEPYVVDNMVEIIMDYYLELFVRDKDHEHLNQITAFYLHFVKLKNNINTMYISSLLFNISLLDDSEDAYEIVYDMLEKLDIELDDTILKEIQRSMASFSQEKLTKYPKLSLIRRNKESSFIKLLRCPSYTLLNYCEELLLHLKNADVVKWREVMSTIGCSVFDVEFGGPEYVLMNQYRDVLMEIRVFEHTPLFREKAENILKDVGKKLAKRDVSDFILLRDLCPVLADYGARLIEEEKECLERVLRVPSHCKIIRFESKLHVFRNSVKRPLLLRVLLSNGAKCGYLIKYNEDLRADAACQSVLCQFNTMTEHTAVTYRVTPLGNDGGVIQFLDNHVTLRGLIRKYYELDGISSSRVRDEALILQPINSALAYFQNICMKIPSYSLRNSMSSESESINEFIYKKHNFLNGVAIITIWHWILGVGDRHLENILYSNDTGCLCSIDWGSIFEHAVYMDSPELMPARLSRCILAVIHDVEVLESKLQNILGIVRVNCKKMISFVHLAFKWRSDYSTEGFQNTLKSIENKLQGSVLPYEITRDVLQQSKVRHKEKYIDILNSIFCDQYKDIYTVEEQVYHLLKQCTDDKILSITRSGWEPWL